MDIVEIASASDRVIAKPHLILLNLKKNVLSKWGGGPDSRPDPVPDHLRYFLYLKKI